MVHGHTTCLVTTTPYFISSLLHLNSLCSQERSCVPSLGFACLQWKEVKLGQFDREFYGLANWWCKCM
jgi:hypothetical protein